MEGSWIEGSPGLQRLPLLSNQLSSSFGCAASFLPHCHRLDLSAAGSKIRVTSIIHMALELAGLEVAYKWLGLWKIRSDAEITKAMQ